MKTFVVIIFALMCVAITYILSYLTGMEVNDAAGWCALGAASALAAEMVTGDKE